MTKDRPRNHSGKRPGNGPKAAENSGFREAAPGRDGQPWRTKGPGKAGPHKGPFKPGRGGQPQRGLHQRRDAAFEDGDNVWIWGLHAAGAALANPRRVIREAMVSRNTALRVGLDLDKLPPNTRLVEPREIDDRLPAGAVHQGIALKAAPLEAVDIQDFIALPDKPLVILDQVTDPQNVGAIFRSAAAFGFGGVVMQTRNAPALGGALAKAAAGAIETVDEIRAVNLSRAIDVLTDAGWRVVGLEGSAAETVGEAFATPEPLAIVMGAEGAGLRHGVANACSHLARIAIGAQMESLNVSNAAAIAFYEASRRNGAKPPPPQAPLRGAQSDETD